MKNLIFLSIITFTIVQNGQTLLVQKGFKGYIKGTEIGYQVTTEKPLKDRVYKIIEAV